MDGEVQVADGGRSLRLPGGPKCPPHTWEFYGQVVDVEELGHKVMVSAGGSIERSRLLSQDQGESVFSAANHDNFGVRALGQIFCGFDAFPFQQLRADSLGDDC